jgi:hypothetical protein
LPDDFLEKAYTLRNKYFPETRGELDNGATIYNAKKIRGICEICKTSMGEETHHLQEQKDANSNGFIGNNHKNHIANLISVCEKCHNNIHSPKKEESGEKIKKRMVKKKTTKGYIILSENV